MEISLKGNDGITRIMTPYGTLSTTSPDTKSELDQARRDIVKMDRAGHGHR